MPGLPRRRGDVLSGVVLALVVVGCDGPRTKKIHAYLGDNTGNTRQGLTGNIMENNKFLREKLTELECRLFKLENPGQPVPQECQPGGPPSTRPTDPPRYP